jgi:hypothetical protein
MGQKLIWNEKRQCVTNEDGTLLNHADDFQSVTEWTDRRYARWCKEGLVNSNKPIVNNSWAWKAEQRVPWGSNSKYRNGDARQWTGV